MQKKTSFDGFIMKNEKRMIDKCRVCGDKDISYLCNTFNEHSKTTSISHYRCSTCGSVFVGNDIDSEELGVAYSTLDSKKYYEEIESETTNKMNTGAKYLETVMPYSNSIIDIGTGNGLFVEILKKSGFSDVSAHEIEGSDLSRIRNIANCIYQDYDYSIIPSDKFDIVCQLLSDHPTQMKIVCYYQCKYHPVLQLYKSIMKHSNAARWITKERLLDQLISLHMN